MKNYDSPRPDDLRDQGYKKNQGRYHQYPMYKDFTILIKLVYEVFSIVKKRGILPPPVAMKTGGGRRFDSNEFYD